ncbi:MAG: hypothetical protein ACF8GE_08245 [Phycisphaerales bacterium JB043]
MMEPTEAQLEALTRLLACTEDEEIDCHAFIESLCEYVESGGAVDGNEELNKRLRLVRQHMDVCPACREEYDAVMRALGLD